MAVEVTFLKKWKIKGRTVRPGDRGLVPSRYVRQLAAVGIAEPSPARPDPANDLSSLTVAALKEIAQLHGISLRAGARKIDIIATIEHAGRYMRRDMRAE